MSGGSYNYLCNRYDAAELLGADFDLDAMADRLAGLGYAQDAARETRELLLSLRSCAIRAETISNRLRGVWKAVEWWDSADWSQEEVRKALAEYRGSAK